MQALKELSLAMEISQPKTKSQFPHMNWIGLKCPL